VGWAHTSAEEGKYIIGEGSDKWRLEEDVEEECRALEDRWVGGVGAWKQGGNRKKKTVDK